MKEHEPPKPEQIICRCEEVTEEEIVQAIESGAATFDEIKRLTRAGMGHCQGTTCQMLVDRLIRRHLPGAEPAKHNSRPPLRPVRLEAFLENEDGSS